VLEAREESITSLTLFMYICWAYGLNQDNVPANLLWRPQRGPKILRWQPPA